MVDVDEVSYERRHEDDDGGGDEEHHPDHRRAQTRLQHKREPSDETATKNTRAQHYSVYCGRIRLGMFD